MLSALLTLLAGHLSSNSLNMLNMAFLLSFQQLHKRLFIIFNVFYLNSSLCTLQTVTWQNVSLILQLSVRQRRLYQIVIWLEHWLFEFASLSLEIIRLNHSLLQNSSSIIVDVVVVALWLLIIKVSLIISSTNILQIWVYWRARRPDNRQIVLLIVISIDSCLVQIGNKKVFWLFRCLTVMWWRQLSPTDKLNFLNQVTFALANSHVSVFSVFSIQLVFLTLLSFSAARHLL